MKKTLFAIAAAASLLAGCQMAEVTPVASKDSKTFEGVIVDGTRASLTADADVWHVTWKFGEKIKINDIVYTATVGEVASTYFIKSVNEEFDAEAPYTAYSPADIAKGLPAVQNYVAGNVEYVPMMATSANETLAFRNLTSMLRLNITTGEAGAAVKRIVLKADQGLSGEFTVENDAAVVSGTAGLTLNCGDGVAIGTDPVPFFVTVPAGTYTGLSVTVVLMDGRSQSLTMKSGSNLVAERSKVHDVALAFNNFTASAAVEGKAVLLPGPDFNAAIKGITVPGAFTTDYDYSITRIVFSTCDPSTEGILVSAADSPVAAYAYLEPTSGVLTLSTAAKGFATGEDASSMFFRLMLIQGFDNLRSLDTEAAVTMNSMFSQHTPEDTTLYALKSLDVSGFNTSNCVDMGSMFNSIRALEHLDVSNFNTSKVENMRFMFGNCRHLEELDLSNFDFSMDTSMANMFYYDENLKSLTFPADINTENVVNFRNIFYNNASLKELDVTKFNTSAATDMGMMFEYCGMLERLDISNFKFALDSTCYLMFAYDSSLVELKLPEVIECDEMTNINSMFRKNYWITEFDMDIFQDADNITGLRYIFAYDKNLKKVKSTTNTWENVTSSAYMFSYNCAEDSGKLDLSEFDVTYLSKFSYMFYKNQAREIDLTNWDTGSSTTMTYMFQLCKNLAVLRLGEKFINPSGQSPTNFMAGTKEVEMTDRTGSVPGAMTIYCVQETADWLATTTLRYVNSGYKTDIPIPVTLLDLHTGAPLTVTWKAN